MTAADKLTLEQLAETTKSPVDAFIDRMAKVLAELHANPVPAKDLCEDQKSALLLAKGLLHFKDGRMVSVCPVAFADGGDGRYVIGVWDRG